MPPTALARFPPFTRRRHLRCLATSPRIQNPAAPPGAVPCSSTLPNVGNEGHTYLSHLVAHWATLPDLLLLLPDTVEYGDKLKTWRRVKARGVWRPLPPPRRGDDDGGPPIRRPQRNLARHGRGVYYADDYTPVSGARFAVNWLNAVFYGAQTRKERKESETLLAHPTLFRGARAAGPNFPCRDHRRGGAECVYHGHTGARSHARCLLPRPTTALARVARPPSFPPLPTHQPTHPPSPTHHPPFPAGANPGGALTPATPPLFPDWLAAHLGGATEADVRACGWGNRGMLAVSRAAVLARPREFYANLVEQLGQAAFPMAGMFMERMWRHTFLCANWRPGGRGRAGGRASGGDARGVRVG